MELNFYRLNPGTYLSTAVPMITFKKGDRIIGLWSKEDPRMHVIFHDGGTDPLSQQPKIVFDPKLKIYQANQVNINSSVDFSVGDIIKVNINTELLSPLTFKVTSVNGYGVIEGIEIIDVGVLLDFGIVIDSSNCEIEYTGTGRMDSFRFTISSDGTNSYHSFDPEEVLEIILANSKKLQKELDDLDLVNTYENLTNKVNLESQIHDIFIQYPTINYMQGVITERIKNAFDFEKNYMKMIGIISSTAPTDTRLLWFETTDTGNALAGLNFPLTVKKYNETNTTWETYSYNPFDINDSENAFETKHVWKNTNTQVGELNFKSSLWYISSANTLQANFISLESEIELLATSTKVNQELSKKEDLIINAVKDAEPNFSNGYFVMNDDSATSKVKVETMFRTFNSYIQNYTPSHIYDEIDAEGKKYRPLVWYMGTMFRKNDLGLPYTAPTDFDSDYWDIVGGGSTGILPDDVINLTALSSDGEITISYTNPSNTVVSGRTICAIKKTILAYKLSPWLSNDTFTSGTVLGEYNDPDTAVSFIHDNLNNGTTYYYKVFVISTTGSINSNTTNEIDQFPAGSALTPYISTCKSTPNYNTNNYYFDLTWVHPDWSNVSRVLINYKIDQNDYPTSPTDGTLLADMSDSSQTTARMQVQYPGSTTNGRYNFSIWVWNSAGVMNASAVKFRYQTTTNSVGAVFNSETIGNRSIEANFTAGSDPSFQLNYFCANEGTVAPTDPSICDYSVEVINSGTPNYKCECVLTGLTNGTPHSYSFFIRGLITQYDSSITVGQGFYTEEIPYLAYSSATPVIPDFPATTPIIGTRVEGSNFLTVNWSYADSRVFESLYTISDTGYDIDISNATSLGTDLTVTINNINDANPRFITIWSKNAYGMLSQNPAQITMNTAVPAPPLASFIVTGETGYMKIEYETDPSHTSVIIMGKKGSMPANILDGYVVATPSITPGVTEYSCMDFKPDSGDDEYFYRAFPSVNLQMNFDTTGQTGNDYITEPQYFSIHFNSTGSSVVPYNDAGTRFQYRLDTSDPWTDFDASQGASIQVDNQIYFRGEGATSLYKHKPSQRVEPKLLAIGDPELRKGQYTNWVISGSSEANIRGEFYTLLDWHKPFLEIGSDAFYEMFINQQQLKYIVDGINIRNKIGASAFQRTFLNTGLINIPPITIVGDIGNYAFANAFQGCTSAVSAQLIDFTSTTVGTSAFYQIMSGCSLMETAMGFNDNATASYVSGGQQFYQVFGNCSKLEEVFILELFGNTAASPYIRNTAAMFYGCSALTTIPELNWGNTGTGFTAEYMFQGCTALSEIKFHLSGTSGLSNWLQNTTGGTVHVLSTAGTVPVPVGWTLVKDL